MKGPARPSLLLTWVSATKKATLLAEVASGLKVCMSTCQSWVTPWTVFGCDPKFQVRADGHVEIAAWPLSWTRPSVGIKESGYSFM